MIWHSSQVSDVLKELDVNSEKGLSNGVADMRIKAFGKNIIKSVEKPSFKKHLLSQLKDRYVYILTVIAIISFVLSLVYNKADFYSPLLIIAIVFLNALITAYQMYKSDLALNSIKSITNPAATVIRDGIEKQIPSDELVPGDIMILKSGDYISADARLIEANNFACNEYVLTGEEIPANKKADATYEDISPINIRANMVFSGCVVVYGSAKAVVVETGLSTEIGHNSALNQQSGGDSLPIEEKLDSAGKIINALILLICAVIFILEVIFNFRNIGFASTTVSALLNAMALAVSAIPEGLPAISTIAVALGIERIIKEEIIIKKVSALEVLGKTTVICADKTGIITKNSMELKKVFDGENSAEITEIGLSDKQQLILKLAANCSTLENDSTENSIKNACIKHCNITSEELDNLFPRVALVPFDSERKTMTSVNMINGKPVAIVKGAPENLADKFVNIDAKTVLEQNESMAAEALRVVCIAIKPLEEIPANPSAELIEKSLTFVGLLGLDDPLRISTIDAIKSNEKAGIKTIMITGDNITTAKAIARRVGILKDGTMAISGAELAQISDEELVNTIGNYSVFARLNPDDKLRIISAFQANGETVTVTGDDFKDVQALASADIGCAMGRLGTDVTRGNADIIIKNSHFDSIVNAIKESRGLFANIQKAVAFLLSCNIAEIAVYFIALLIFKNPPITAVQLLWINLLTDCAPVIALATSKAEESVMDNTPLSLNGRIFDNRTMIDIAIQAVFMTATTLAAYFIGYKSGNIQIATTSAFCVLALSQVFHTFNIRTSESIFKSHLSFNDFMFVSCILIAFIILFLVFTPAGAVFGLTLLKTKYAVISILLSIAIIPFCELLKIAKTYIKR